MSNFYNRFQLTQVSRQAQTEPKLFIHRRSFAIGFLLISLCLSRLALGGTSQVLLGQPVSGILTASQRMSYPLNLSAGQYVEISLIRGDTNLRVRLKNPRQQILREFSENDWTLQYLSSISWIAAESGVYVLEFESADPTNIPSLRTGYRFALEALRSATSEDKIYLEAYEQLMKARVLTHQGSDGQRQALANYQAALDLVRGKISWAEANILREMGWIDYALGQRPIAIEKHQAALALFRQLGRPRETARTISNLGRFAQELGQDELALAHFTEALSLYADNSDPAFESLCLTWYAGLIRAKGDAKKATDLHLRILQLRREAGNQDGEIRAMGSLAQAYFDNGEQEKAINLWEAALQLPQVPKYRGAEQFVVSGLGVAYRRRNELQKALNTYLRTMPQLPPAPTTRDESSLIANMGSTYQALGEYAQAAAAFEKSLAFERSVKNNVNVVTLLSNLGLAYRNLKNFSLARDYYQQSLELAQQRNNPLAMIPLYINIAGLHAALGEDEAAHDKYQSVVTTFEQAGRPAAHKRSCATALTGLSRQAWKAGNFTQAIDYAQQAVTLYREANDPSGQSLALTMLARTHFALDDWKQAESSITAALEIIESIRESLVNPAQRASFQSTLEAFDVYLDMLMRRQNLQEQKVDERRALQLVERARTRSLLGLLAEAHLDLRQGLDLALLEQGKTLRDQLNRKAVEKTALLSGKNIPAQLKSVDDAILALKSEMLFHENKLRVTHPRYANLTLPQPLDVPAIQQMLDADTVLLQYAFGEKGAYLWAVSATQLDSYTLASQTEIKLTAQRFYQALAQRPTGAQATLTVEAAKLSQLLLTPLASRLNREWRNKRLVIVAPEALQYIPFGVLPAPAMLRRAKAATLLEQHELITLPSSSSLAFLRNELSKRQPATQTVAVVADPVFATEDARVKTAPSAKDSTARNDSNTLSLTRALRNITNDERAGLQRLLFSREEAESIAAIAPANSIFKALDFAASRTTVLSNRLADYRIVHFATHGLLDSADPELSGLALSLVDERGRPQDGYLRLNEIYNLKLNADLVVLSACQTGLGKEVKGEGLIGLTRGFMYAGAPRIVASLWQVNDAATAELMKRFYRGMLKEKLRPAAALRQAQLELMKKPAWKSPYYWGAFVLQGEWK